MPALDRKGTFRVTIDGYGFEKAKNSNAHCVVLKCTVLEQYDFDTESWIDWRGFEPHEVWGRIWIITKEGKVNATGAESLIRNADWDGDILSLQNQTWVPTQCSVSVKEDVWEGKTSYKVSFVNGWDEVPSGDLGNVDDASAKQLAAQYGSNLRAIAGTVKQNAPKPAGKPASPPVRKPVPVATAAEIAAQPAVDSEVPF